MSRRTKLALNILEAALLLGVLGDALLRETPWGLNVLLWTGALVAAIWTLQARYGGGGASHASWRADGGWLFLPVLFFAAAFAWRDSATLNFLDGLALFVSLALLAWRARGRSIRLGGVADYVWGLGHAAFSVLFASLPLIFNDVQWATIPRHGAMRHVWAVARGLVIAVPLLFIFGALLMAADAVFEGIMQRAFQFDGGVLFSHFFLMLLFAWMTAGFLRGMMLGVETMADAVAPPPPAQPAPHAYTSITIDDRERRGTETAGAAGEGEPDGGGGHRQPPESVVVEGGATAEGVVSGAPHDRAVKPESEAAEQQPHGGEGEKPPQVSNGEEPQGVAEVRAQASQASDVTASAAAQAAAVQASPGGFSLGAVEVCVVLGLLNVLFACFVAVQFRYFFGGAERVMSITELTYSEYARRGFFELTWVAGLVLPLLLGIHALLRKDSPAATRIFRPLAGAQIALLFVIMASAIARMRLYQSEYGLTELRLYTTAFMLWLGLVFVWFSWTVLVRANRQRFACGALVAAFVTVGLLHLLNPDAYIVRANLAHARAGRSFDAGYAATLSADAVPALISALPALTRDERCYAASEISRRWTPTWRDEDWRGWNFARWRARRAVTTHGEALSKATCPPPPSGMPVTTGGATVVPSTTEPPPPPAPVPPATNALSTSTTNSNTSAATNANAPAATTGARTMTMISEIKEANAGASNAAQAARRAERKTGRYVRPRAARKAKTR